MNIYIDAGFYAGLTLRRYVDSDVVDDTWDIYAFEPNPDLPTQLHKDQINIPYKLMREAVWIKDGTVKFNISRRENASSIKGTSGQTDPEEITVKSIDFSRFVKELPEAYILCSMDIEGSEFKVLEKMLKDNTIDKINVLDIEFHHRLMLDETPEDAERLIKQIKDRGVDLRLKDKLR